VNVGVGKAGAINFAGVGEVYNSYFVSNTNGNLAGALNFQNVDVQVNFEHIARRK